MAGSPIFLGKSNNVKFNITSTMVASTNPTIYTAGSSGSRVYDLVGFGSGSSAISVQLALSTGGTPSYPIGSFTASTTKTPVDIYSTMATRFSVDTDGNRYLTLVSGDLLVAIPGSSIASGTFSIYGSAADY